MDYSVVIRTKNCAASILNCLELVLAQSSKPFEIIVVDSGSTDKTVEIAKQLNCKIIYYPNNCAFNFSKALNIGIAEVRSKIVCCLSSHVMIHDANLIKYMIQNLEQLSLTGISSNCQNLMLRKKKQFEEAEKKNYNNR